MIIDKQRIDSSLFQFTSRPIAGNSMPCATFESLNEADRNEIAYGWM